jgi:hypothetical protein
VDKLLYRLSGVPDRSGLTEMMTPDEEDFIKSVLKVHIILYRAQKQNELLAQEVTERLESTEEFFTASPEDHEGGVSELESFIEARVSAVARYSHARLWDLARSVARDVLLELQEMEAHFKRYMKSGSPNAEDVDPVQVRHAIRNVRRVTRSSLVMMRRKSLEYMARLEEGPGQYETTEKYVDAVGADVQEGFKNIFKGIFKKISNAMKNVVGKALAKPFLFIKKGFQKFGNLMKKVGKAIGKKIKAAFQKIKKGMEKFLGAVKNAFKKFGQMIKNAFKKFGKMFVDGFKKVGKALGKFFLPFIKFFIYIGLTAYLIGMFFKDFVTNPFVTLLKILMLIGSIVFAIALLLIYILLSIGPALLMGYIFSVVGALLLCFLEFLLYLAIVVLSFVVFTVIWILDMLTGGVLTFLLRCENHPDAWYRQPGFERGNAFKRVLLCFAPCASGWRRTSIGGFCVKQVKSCPAYCPQQQIFGFYSDLAERGKSGGGPYIYDRFLPDMQFYGKDVNKKRDAILKTYKDKNVFLGQCLRNMKDYNFVTRHVCSNVDVITESVLLHSGQVNSSQQNLLIDAAYAEEVKSKLRALCKQSFCNFDFKLGPDGKPLSYRRDMSGSEQWCNWMKPDGGDGMETVTDDALGEFLICLMLLIIGTVACFLIITVQGYMDVPARPPPLEE